MLLQLAQQPGLIPQVLFESPGWAMAGLALVWAPMRVIGRRTGNKRLLGVSWVPLGLIGVLLATSYFVTTPRERLAQTVQGLLLAVEDNDQAAIKRIVAPETMTDFLSREMDRDEMLKRIGEATIDDLNLTGLVVLTEPGDQAQTLMNVRAKGSMADVPGIEISQWATRWRYEDGRWVAFRFECTAIGLDAVLNNP